MCLELGGVSGAEASGRVWALMYDISGAAPATLLQKLQADWEHVTNDLKFTEGAHHHHHHRRHRHRRRRRRRRHLRQDRHLAWPRDSAPIGSLSSRPAAGGRYLHHRGNPIVSIWGLGFKDPKRNLTGETAKRVTTTLLALG